MNPSVLALCLLTTQLHLLRNVTDLFLLLYFLIFAYSIFVFERNYTLVNNSTRKLFNYILLFFCIATFSILYGIILDQYESIQALSVGLVRWWYSFPIYVFVLLSPRRAAIDNLLKLLVSVLFIMACSSIIYQVSFGRIEWFADSSERSGLARYSSLYGSLTILGNLVAPGVITLAIAFKRQIAKILMVLFVFIAAILSLQKAALINFLLGLLSLTQRANFGFKNISIALVIISTFCGFAELFYGDQLLSYVANVKFSQNSDVITDDVSIEESIVERLYLLPGHVFDFFPDYSWTFGLGPVGGSGAFGFTDVPMAHNGLVDLIFIGGLPLLFLFITGVYIVTKFYVCNVRVIPRQDRLYFYGLFFILLNIPFSGLIFLSPAGALFTAFFLRHICNGLNKCSIKKPC